MTSLNSSILKSPVKAKAKQKGLSAIGMLVVILVAVFFGNFAIKVIPLYIENATVQNAVETVVEQAESGQIKSSEIKSTLGKMFQVNMIEILDPRTGVQIKREKGKTIVDARYDRQVHLMFNMDIVVKFDQLVYEFVSPN